MSAAKAPTVTLDRVAHTATVDGVAYDLLVVGPLGPHETMGVCVRRDLPDAAVFGGGAWNTIGPDAAAPVVVKPWGERALSDDEERLIRAIADAWRAGS